MPFQEPCIMCQILIFGGHLGGKRAKKWSKITKKSVLLRISGTISHLIDFGTHV